MKKLSHLAGRRRADTGGVGEASERAEDVLSSGGASS